MQFTFAELLRSFRQRASLNQAALAAALAVHGNTISGWERGLYRPKEREQVLRLAEDLALTPTETDQLLRAADFSPAHGTLDPLTARHQLRAPVADFVGRVAEAQQLRMALQAARLPGTGAIISGVRGMGGIGKTELAYRVAHDLRATFPDGQIVLDLCGTSAEPLSAAQALQKVIRAFALDTKLPVALEELQPLYRSLLHERQILILADDAHDAAQVRPLLPPAGCALLVTSRVRFSLPGMTTIDLEQLAADEAIALLYRICPRLSKAEAQVLAQNCCALPLALRISGGILHNDPALPIADYLAGLADERQRLTQLRDPDDPQLNVEASLSLSYVQLALPVRQVFRQLGVFVADFSTALASVVVDAPVGEDVETMLHLLVRRNLVMYDAQWARWRLHDLVRNLARRTLEAEQEHEAVLWRYTRAVVQLAQETQDHYLTGGDAALAALARFDAERPHIDAARRWVAAQVGTPEGDQLLLDAAAATRYLSELRDDVRCETIPQWERVHKVAIRLGKWPSEMLALTTLGRAYCFLGDFRRALSYYEQSLTIARAQGDRQSEGNALGNLGHVYGLLGETRRAIVYLEQDITSARALGDRRREGMALLNLGVVYVEQDEPQRALPYYQQSLSIARALGDRRVEGFTMHNLGNAYTDLGEIESALECCTVAHTTARTLGDRRLEGYTLSGLARAQAYRGNLVQATTVFRQGITRLREVGDRWGEAECGWLFGLALADQGEREQAMPLLRTALAYEEEIGHANARERAVVLARLEAGEDLAEEGLGAGAQRTVGERPDVV